MFCSNRVVRFALVMMMAFSPFVYAKDAPWLVRLSAHTLPPDDTLSQLDSRIIYRFLNGDVLLASYSPSELVAATSASVSYLEQASAISEREIKISAALSFNDHLREDGIAALGVSDRQCDQVKIAVIDSGIDQQHIGWGSTVFEQAKSVIDVDSSINDAYGHGTHVTGIISSDYSSVLGKVEGSCTSATVIPIRFLDGYGNGTIADSIEATQWAINAGAKVINHSWVTSSDSTALRDVLIDVNQRGIVQIAAAGNYGSNNDRSDLYPTNYASQLDGMLSVANWDGAIDRLNSTSNYSYTRVDIAASGTNILSLYPDNNAQILSGTSMAAPIVSSVAAMLWQQDSLLSAAQINAKITTSVKPEASLIGKVSTQGRLNALSAMTLGELPTSITGVTTTANHIVVTGALLEQVTQWKYRPALSGAEEYALTSTMGNDERVEFAYSELPYGYFQGYSDNDELLVSYPYQSELIAPSEVKLSPHGSELLLVWRGSIWANSYEIQEYKNGRFSTIETVLAPTNQLTIDYDPTQSVRYRVRAKYQYQFDDQPIIEAHSLYSGEVEAGNLFPLSMVRMFADIPKDAPAYMLLDLDSSANYQLVDDPDGKVIGLSGNQIHLDSSEVGEWSVTLINDASLSMLSFRVIDGQNWILRSTQGASIKVAADQASIVSVSEMGEQKIAITATPLQSPYILSLTIEGSYYTFNDIDIEMASASATSWKVVSRSENQLNLQIEAQGTETFIVQPKISAPLAESSSDSRCFIASKVYAKAPNKVNKLRVFRDQVLAELPGGQWFIDLYYQYSPRLVEWSERYPKVTSMVRKMLDQLVKYF